MQYKDVSKYVQNLVGKGDELLAWTGERSYEFRKFGVFQIDPSCGRFLELVARLISPKRVLEVGPGVGYSTLWFLKGMPESSKLDAIEQEPTVAEALTTTLRKAGLRRRVRILRGEALHVLPRMKGPYDIVFIDAAKEEYPDYLEHAFRLTRPGSIILAHNLFWGGAAIRRHPKDGAEGIREYTKRIFTDSRLSSLIVPLGDGMSISYRVT